MNKIDLIGAMQVIRPDLQKDQLEAGLEAMTEAIHRGISAGETKFNLTGLGIFYVVEKKSRTGRNPKTGVKVNIPSGWKFRFKTSSAIKATLKKLKTSK